MEKNIKKIVAVGLAAFVVGAVGTGAIISSNSLSQEDIDSAKAIAFKEGSESVEPVVINNTVVETVTEVIETEVEKIVEVDNGDLDFVLERLEDKEVISDAEDIVLELKAEDKAIKGAFDFVEDNEDELFDMLEEAGIVDDEDEVEIIKVYDDFEDVSIIKSDFDDLEYKFELKFKIEDLEEEVKKYINVKVKLEDSEFEIVKVSEE